MVSRSNFHDDKDNRQCPKQIEARLALAVRESRIEDRRRKSFGVHSQKTREVRPNLYAILAADLSKNFWRPVQLIKRRGANIATTILINRFRRFVCRGLRIRDSSESFEYF